MTREAGYEFGYPEGASFRLQALVDAVAPLDTSIGRWDERASWRLHQKPDQAEATPEQIAAARAVMAAFDPWGDGSDIGALAEDEDPGDLGGEMLAAQDEAEGGGEPVPGIATDDASPGEQEQVAGAVDHGGVLIQYDQVEIARAQIAMKVSDHEEILVGALSNRWPVLTKAFEDTNNLDPAQWEAFQPGITDLRAEFMRLSQIEASIRKRAVDLRRSVRDATADQLRNIDAHLFEDWPTA